MSGVALAVVLLAPAAEPPASRLTPAETRFLTSALAEYRRDTWADPGPDAPPWTSAGVTGFVARRTAEVGDLMQYLRSRNAPAELVRGFDEYREFLNTGTALAAKLREREDKHLAFYVDLRLRLTNAEKARQADGNLAVLAAASDAVRGLMDANGAIPGEQLFSGQAGNLIAARVLTVAAGDRVTAARAEELAQARKDAAEYEKREGPVLAADLTAIRRDFLGKLTADRPAPAADDPFAAAFALSKKPAAKTADAIAEQKELAAKCLAAVAAVPSHTAGLKHDPYRPFRAKLAATAGTAATTAAVAAAPGGFAAAAKFPAPNPAADLAVRAWATFRKHDPSPAARVQSARQEAIAVAAAGRLDPAYRLMAVAAKEAGNYPDPAFWYDAARVAGASGKYPDVAAGWFKKAADAGFADADRARTDPDLDSVRRKLGAGFEKMLAPE